MGGPGAPAQGCPGRPLPLPYSGSQGADSDTPEPASGLSAHSGQPGPGLEPCLTPYPPAHHGVSAPARRATGSSESILVSSRR